MHHKVMISLGETALKGIYTRRKFESILVSNLKNTLNVKKIRKDGGKFLIEVEGDYEEIKYKISKIFGIATFAFVEEYNYESLDKLKEIIKNFDVKNKKFRITAKVIGNFPFNSIELQKILGEVLYYDGGIVKLKDFEIEIFVYLKDNKVQIYNKIYKGSLGLPLGSQGKVLVLFSGGIDSPVASWEIMRRGCLPTFLFINLGGSEHLKQVYEVYEKLCNEWCLGVETKFNYIDGKEIVNLIKKKIKPSYKQIVLKKIFYLIAEKVAVENKYDAIITGENIGQVSTQTLKNLNAIQMGINKIIIRPLITFEKEEIVKEAIKIGTYNHSTKIGELCNISDGGGLKTASSQWEVEREYSKIREEVEEYLENVSIDTFIPQTLPSSQTQQTQNKETPIYINLSQDKINIKKMNKNSFYIIHCKDGVQASIECDILKNLGFNCTSMKTSKIKK